jgi:Skp family chaperone for outer membrane proteins
MKFLIKTFIYSFFLVICTQVFAEQKIVVLDMKYVLNNSKAGKEAQELLKNKLENDAKKFTEIEKKLKKEERDLLEKKNVLSKEEYKKKSDELRKSVIEYQSQRRISLDKIGKQRATAKKQLLKKLDPIISSYIKENSISLVMDKKNMIGGKVEYNITEVIVEKLNKELPSLKLD